MTIQSNTTPTRFVEADGTRFAYRRFGDPVGTPMVLLQHLMGNLDNYDPAITDALAMGREVILTDNAGVGLSTGNAPETVAGMARDAASLIDALDLEHVDLFGFSMGGYVAQQIVVDRPDLVRRLVLVGTGPRGGDGMDELAPDVVPLFQTVYEPQDLMWLPIFFSPSEASQIAGRHFLDRIRAAPTTATPQSRRPPSPRISQPRTSGARQLRTASTTSKESRTPRSSSTAATTSSSPPSTPTSCNRTCRTPSWSSSRTPTTGRISSSPSCSTAT